MKNCNGRPQEILSTVISCTQDLFVVTLFYGVIQTTGVIEHPSCQGTSST